MLNNNYMFNFDDYDFYDYNFIKGIPLTDDELKKVNLLINYDFKNSNQNEINNVINNNTHNIFKTHDSIKFNKKVFEVVEKKNKKYWKYEGDENLYIINYSSYIALKKELFLYFNQLMIILNNHIEQDIKDYLNMKFFNNIKSCKYYNCLRWFCCLFIYFLYTINDENLYLNKINYKDFRKYILNFHKNKTNYEIMKKVLIAFKNIDFKYKYYEEIKEFLNFCLFSIFDGFYILR